MMKTAIFYIRPSIVRASSGKCAVASAAYMAAEKLYDERLNKSFSYKTKEEVIHTEILLPKNAPEKYRDREQLWNSVEKANDRINAQWARQLIIAVPNEWNRQEVIERSREYIQKEFVDKGMIADWAYHEKDGNHHLHVMLTLRGIGEDGKWLAMEKKAYALDANGNRIPLIDPKTGEQKVREREQNGHHLRELCWKRITVQSNTWNSREQLKEWKHAWAEHCNRYLSREEQIDPRSYKERGIDKIPEVHEGPAARQAVQRGEENWRVEENRERRALNHFFEKTREAMYKARDKINEIAQQIKDWRQTHDKRRSIDEERSAQRHDVIAERLPESTRTAEAGTRIVRHQPRTGRSNDKGAAERARQLDSIIERVSEGRRKLEELIGRNRALAESLGAVDDRKHRTAEITGRVDEIVNELQFG